MGDNATAFVPVTVKQEPVDSGYEALSSSQSPSRSIPQSAARHSSQHTNGPQMSQMFSQNGVQVTTEEIPVSNVSLDTSTLESVCAVASESVQKSRNGIPEHKEILLYWCNFCSFKSQSKDTLLEHVCDHIFHCKSCLFQSFSRAAAINHCAVNHTSLGETAKTLKYCIYIRHIPDVSQEMGHGKKRKMGEPVDGLVESKKKKMEGEADVLESKGAGDGNDGPGSKKMRMGEVVDGLNSKKKLEQADDGPGSKEAVDTMESKKKKMEGKGDAVGSKELDEAGDGPCSKEFSKVKLDEKVDVVGSKELDGEGDGPCSKKKMQEASNGPGSKEKKMDEAGDALGSKKVDNNLELNMEVDEIDTSNNELNTEEDEIDDNNMELNMEVEEIEEIDINQAGAPVIGKVIIPRTAEGKTTVTTTSAHQSVGELPVISNVISGRQAVSEAISGSRPVEKATTSTEPSPSVSFNGVAPGVTVSSGLCWNCGYCGFVTLSQSYLKTHLNHTHAFKAHKYVAMLVSSEVEMTRIKESDAHFMTSPTNNPNHIVTLTGNKTASTSKPAAATIVNASKASSPEASTSWANTMPGIVIDNAESNTAPEPIEDEEAEKNIPVSYKCAHCNFSAAEMDKVRLHLFQRHFGSVIYALDMKAVKLRKKRYVFFCMKSKCKFHTKEADEFLEHAHSCTPWEDCKTEKVDSGLIKSLQLTKTFIEKTAKVSVGEGDGHVDRAAEYSCLYCSYLSNNNTRLKKHVLLNHSDKTFIIKDLLASKRNMMPMVYFCKYCLWETRDGEHMGAHIRDRHSEQVEADEKKAAEATDKKPVDVKKTAGSSESKNQNQVEVKKAAETSVNKPAVISKTGATPPSVTITSPNQRHTTVNGRKAAPQTDKKPVMKKTPGRKPRGVVVLEESSEEESVPDGSSDEELDDDEEVVAEEGAEKAGNEYDGFVTKAEFDKALEAFIKHETEQESQQTGRGRPARNAALKCRMKVKMFKRPPLFACDHCSHMAFGGILIKRHLRETHVTQPLQAIEVLKKSDRVFCPAEKCALHFGFVTDVIIHARNCHGMKPTHPDLQRLSSGQTTSNIIPNVMHGRPATKSTGESYECLYCTKSMKYYSRRDMKKHLVQSHSSEDFLYRDCIARKLSQPSRFYMCHELTCDFISDKEKEYTMHKLAHKNAKIYECTKCEWFTEDVKQVAKHKKSVHPKEAAKATEIDLTIDSKGKTVMLVSGTVIKSEKL